MTKPTTIFISYKTGEDDGLTFCANTIRQFLKQHANGYQVWMDTQSLKAGEEWNRQIYEQIPRSDVVLLLVAEATAKSNWVAREVDFAKGARVTILPVLIRGGYDVKQVMERFDLTTVQYVRLLNGEEDELGRLVTAIEELKGKTAVNQKSWLEDLARLQPAKPYKRTPGVAGGLPTYKVPGLDCEVTIAGGDMFEVGKIDVYVNSENDYMQMARIFESKTVSSLLRFYGSKLDDAGRILEDSVQDELEEYIRKFDGIRTRPVSIGTVIATGAGHRESMLQKRFGGRYIVHTATVAIEGDGPNKSLQCRLIDSTIRRCVRCTLDKVLDIDKLEGVISPPGTERFKQQTEDAKKYVPIKSVILPLFGAGRGGRPAEEIVDPLVQAVQEFLLDVAADAAKKQKFALERIYIAAYLEDDVALVKDALAKAFVKPPA